jgi:RNA polymerase sigma factor (TIGR02999 family)
VGRPGIGEVTELLVNWNQGDAEALERLLPLVYDELRQVASRLLQGERPNHILQPTALVNEAYIRLLDKQGVPWKNRSHFFAIAARVMRRILVDAARRRDAAKRKGISISLSDADVAAVAEKVDLIALDEALEELSRMNARQSRVVELRHFGGLSFEEIAEALGISVPSVKRDWSLAKVWLYRRLSATSVD